MDLNFDVEPFFVIEKSSPPSSPVPQDFLPPPPPLSTPFRTRVVPETPPQQMPHVTYIETSSCCPNQCCTTCCPVARHNQLHTGLRLSDDLVRALGINYQDLPPAPSTATTTTPTASTATATASTASTATASTASTATATASTSTASASTATSNKISRTKKATAVTTTFNSLSLFAGPSTNRVIRPNRRMPSQIGIGLRGSLHQRSRWIKKYLTDNKGFFRASDRDAIIQLIDDLLDELKKK